jgi:hypothetical protein
VTSNGVGCRNFDAGRKNAFLIPGKLTLHAVPKASLTKRLIVLTTLSRIFIIAIRASTDCVSEGTISTRLSTSGQFRDWRIPTR